MFIDTDHPGTILVQCLDRTEDKTPATMESFASSNFVEDAILEKVTSLYAFSITLASFSQFEMMSSLPCINMGRKWKLKIYRMTPALLWTSTVNVRTSHCSIDFYHISFLYTSTIVVQFWDFDMFLGSLMGFEKPVLCYIAVSSKTPGKSLHGWFDFVNGIQVRIYQV